MIKECFGYIDNHYPEDECSECEHARECTILVLKKWRNDDT